MALLSLQDIHLAFGGHPLLDGASLQIQRRERIGLLGRNGEGKSTLLKVISGEQVPDEGQRIVASGVKVGHLIQQVPSDLDEAVAEVVRAGLDAHHTQDHPVERICSLLKIDPEQPFGTLSGGQKRRALLGRALVSEPEILLLDEPTNHLDLDSIEWLESYLARFAGSLLFVSHDREFLQRLSTRILELDRGRLTSWDCDYPTYLKRKAAQLDAEEEEWAKFDKKLAKEEAWIRQGIKARRTRNEGRVRSLERLRVERAGRRERTGDVKMSIQRGERSGTKVIVAEGVGFGYEAKSSSTDILSVTHTPNPQSSRPPGSTGRGTEFRATPPAPPRTSARSERIAANNDADGSRGHDTIIRDFSTTIVRGDRVGIIGPNGCGKTTLLKLMLDQLPPKTGTVSHGTALQIAVFDQHRHQLDESKTVFDNVADGRDMVTIDGKNRHLMSYLQDFLFSPDRTRQPVSSLSGGERNRLLLARLFTQPSNVLVLDEPTNDLDTETLEVLEARLLDYPGTVLAVSHDRRFLDNLCSSVLVFEGDGKVSEYVGGYSDWQAQKKPDRPAAPVPQPKANRPSGGRKKLSNREREEWESLPTLIEQMEQELQSLQATMSNPAFFRGEPEEIQKASERVAALPDEIEQSFERWAELDERK